MVETERKQFQKIHTRQVPDYDAPLTEEERAFEALYERLNELRSKELGLPYYPVDVSKARTHGEAFVLQYARLNYYRALELGLITPDTPPPWAERTNPPTVLYQAEAQGAGTSQWLNAPCARARLSGRPLRWRRHRTLQRHSV